MVKKAGKIGDQTLALDPQQQTAFAKAVKNAKRLVKEKEAAATEEVSKYRRGIIRLNHIPHGFFEDELRKYFAQFGHVLRIRLARSPKTGKSKGYAFIEFEFEEVAKIAVECMNGYLMFERLLKCELVSPDVNANKLFSGRFLREDNFPKLHARKRVMAQQEERQPNEKVQEILQSRLTKLEEQNKKFAELGIDYKFSTKTLRSENNMPKASPQTVKTPEMKKTSPKMIQSRKSAGKLQAQPQKLKTPEMKKTKSTPEKLQKRKSDVILQASPQKVKTPEIKKAKSTPEKLQKRKSDDAVPKAQTPETKKKSTPEKLQKRKSDDSSVSQASPLKEKTPEIKKTKFSPKMLRGRKSEAVPQAQPQKEKTPEMKKTKFSPKMLRSRNTSGMPQAPPQSEKTPEIKKSKVSPKMLRSRNKSSMSQAPPTKEKTPEMKKTKFSPKMLRSRKSDASALTPKPSSPKTKKTPGRKSVR